MPTVLGKNTIVGVIKSAYGSAVQAVGAGNKIDVLEGVKVAAPTKNKVDEDGLDTALKHTWSEPSDLSIELPLAPKYQTLEPIVGLALGLESAVQNEAKASNPLAYVHEFKVGTPENQLTCAIGKAGGTTGSDVVEVIEGQHCAVSEFTIEQSDLGRAKMSAKLIPTDIEYDSAINTPAVIVTCTPGDASYPVNLLTFDHLKNGGLFLTHQNNDAFGTSQKVAVSKFSCKIKPGIGEGAEENYSSSGRQCPVASGKPMAEVSLTLFRDTDTTKTLYDLIRNGEKFKLKPYWKSDRGIPGCSISATSPSTDISGQTDNKLECTITHVGQNVSEAVEITLTLTGLNTGALIAAAIQTAFRAKTATSTYIQEALDKFVCTYNSTVSGKYYLSAATSTLYTFAITAASGTDLKDELKLGSGMGTEPTYVPYQAIIMIPEIVFDPPDDEISLSAKQVNLTGFAMASYGSSTPVGFTTSDEAYLQSSMTSEAIRILFINRSSSEVL